jgi:hypothetical protein
MDTVTQDGDTVTQDGLNDYPGKLRDIPHWLPLQCGDPSVMREFSYFNAFIVEG